MTTYTPAVMGTGVKASVQRVGGYLVGMVMPNIAAFIAWGLITVLFIPTGWLPNAKFAALASPIITILLPVLIGYTGGRMVHGQRGAVVGAVATVGLVGFGRPAEKEARERDAAERAAAAADRRRTPVPAGLVAAARSWLDREDGPKVSGGDTTGVTIEP